MPLSAWTRQKEKPFSVKEFTQSTTARATVHGAPTYIKREKSRRYKYIFINWQSVELTLIL